MRYILLGGDEFSANESLKQIKKSIGAVGLLEVNTSEFEGGEITPDQLKTVCATVPFLAEKRLVIVRGLLERFQPKRRGAQPRTAGAGQNREDGYKLFADAVSNIPQSTILILIDGGEVKNDNPLLLALKPNARVNSFTLKRGRGLENWIQERVQTVGSRISPQAANLLARLVGSNLWLMSNEIDKLILFASGRRIEEEDVTSLTTSAREITVFNLVDAIFEGKCDVAEGLLQRLLMTGEAPAYLLFMLARQFQMMVRMKDMREHGRPKAEIWGKLGLTAEFVWQKTLEQSERYGFPRLKKIYQKLLETDLAIKTGKYDGEMAMSILVAELCQQS